MKEHFRNICKAERSGCGGTSKDETQSNWTYIREFSFMKQFFITRRYTFSINIIINILTLCMYYTF